MNEELRIWAYFSHPYRAVRIGATRWVCGETFMAQPVTWEKRTAKDIGTDGPSLFSISPEEAQTLADALWDAGIKPTQGHGSAGQLGATEKHLSDMQHLTQRLLGAVLKESTT